MGLALNLAPTMSDSFGDKVTPACYTESKFPPKPTALAEPILSPA